MLSTATLERSNAAGIPPGSADAPTPPATAALIATAALPRIGQPWPGGGLYVGLARGEGDAPDAHLVLLDDKPATELTWKNALTWAEALGEGAHVPTRDESALLYAHLREHVETGYWYWTSTQYSAELAWLQYFLNGDQIYDTKQFKARARAVRRFPL